MKAIQLFKYVPVAFLSFRSCVAICKRWARRDLQATDVVLQKTVRSWPRRPQPAAAGLEPMRGGGVSFGARHRRFVRPQQGRLQWRDQRSLARPRHRRCKTRIFLLSLFICYILQPRVSHAHSKTRASRRDWESDRPNQVFIFCAVYAKYSRRAVWEQKELLRKFDGLVRPIQHCGMVSTPIIIIIIIISKIVITT